MNPIDSTSTGLTSTGLIRSVTLLICVLAAGCGERILGMGDMNGAMIQVPDETRPTVTFTVPADGATAVVINTQVSATFGEDMDPATLTAPGTFTLCANPCVTPVAGPVTYAPGARTATLAPAAALATNTLFTATVTTTATDVAGNALAADYVWTFTTGNTTDATAPTVTLVSPADLAVGVCPAAVVSATFSEDMGPQTIDATTFTLQVTSGPGPVLSATVSYNPPGRVATLTPSVDLIEGTNYTATVTTGVEDHAGNALATAEVWSFTVGPPTGICALQAQPVVLGSAAPFGTMGGSSGMTNQGTLTVINGDIATTAVSTAVTGFHDPGFGCTYTETASNIGTVNGKIYTAAPPPTVDCPSEGTAGTFEIARQAREDALAAYNYLAGLATTGTPLGANLSGVTVPPGVYAAPGGSFQINGLNDLTLDGQGDANAVWVFQMASSLTVGGASLADSRSVQLINGAQAKNVFWQVGSAATINPAGGGTMKGTIISQNGAAFSTAGSVSVVTLDGRMLSLGASVTVVNTVINVPAP